VYNYRDFAVFNQDMKITNPKFYTFLVGLILFLLGLFGFAFRGSFGGIANHYLFLSLVLGFWGVVISVQKAE
jgi:hypothetical protein